ncbi:MAG TPA: LptF/LptG family permease [Chthonomonas sp.]|jgi:lipopolysaccharide export system permease protein|uniref:LptF/LptG family permease n=1 Tax=Chthonomonas sp. TaxID=2282153 RepID=UPI002B4B7F4A|nr:LptF/LptG family permease [Chthonomonas sp.]HLH79065.1 LptF/LptG family permease [Chthonomonas sp.]
MKLIDKLVLYDLIGPFLTGMFMFLVLVFTAGFLFQATDMVVQGVPLNLVLKFVLYALPGILTQTFPMAMLLASLMALGRLSADREIVAIFTAGIGFPRVVLPVFVVGLLVSIVAFTWNETVVPPATRAMYDLKQEALQHIAKSDEPISYDIKRQDGRGLEESVYVQGGYDARTQTLRDVRIVRYSDDPAMHGAVELIVNCARAQSTDRRGLDQSGLNWTYYDGSWVLLVPDKATGLIKDTLVTNFKTLKVLPDNASIGKSFNEVMNAQVNDANRLSFNQLRREIERDRAEGRIEEARGEEVDLYGKIALPLASVIFGVVGAALGLNTQRGGSRTVGFGMAIFIVFLYWVFYHAMFVIGKSGGLPPMLASFSADMVGAAVGIWLTLRAST